MYIFLEGRLSLDWIFHPFFAGIEIKSVFKIHRRLWFKTTVHSAFYLSHYLSSFMASYLLRVHIRTCECLCARLCVCLSRILFFLRSRRRSDSPLKQFAIVDTTHMEMCYALLVSFSRLHEDLYNTSLSAFMKPDCYYPPTVTHSWTSFEIEQGECR